MDGRKLQRSGGSTFQVALPRQWVLDRGLKPGDLVYVEAMDDGSVVVRSDPAVKAVPERKVFEVDRLESSDHLLRKLIGAYVASFHTIEIRHDPTAAAACRRVAREFCRRVNGVEVVDESTTHLVLQDLSNGVEVDPVRCLRRMHLLVRAMLNDALRAVRDGDSSRVESAGPQSEDVSRMCWIIARNTQPSAAASRPVTNDALARSPYPWLVAKLLERTAGRATELARRAPALRRLRDVDADVFAEVESSVTIVIEMLDAAVGALFSNDSDLANEAIDSVLRLQDSLESLLARLSLDQSIAWTDLQVVVETVGGSAGHVREIAKHALDVAVLREPTRA